MKKWILVAGVLWISANASAWAQSSAFELTSSNLSARFKKSPTSSQELASLNIQTELNELSLAQSLASPLLTDSKSTEGRLAPRGLQFKKTSLTQINFSKLPRIDYGLATSLTQTSTPTFLKNEIPATESKATLSTKAYATYRVTPNFSLNSSLNFNTGEERSKQLSLGSHLQHLVGQKHLLSSSLSINWTRPSEKSSNFFSYEPRSYPPLNNFNPVIRQRTELKFATTWHWTLDTNWSLSTGISARRVLSESNHDAFSSTRTPVTIFSVATYRF